MNKQKAELFLEELTALSKRYGIKLWSCSCCEGINLQDVVEADVSAKYVCNADSGGYITTEFKG